jgi:hypothetical protein
VLFKDDFTKPNRAWARYPNWDFWFAISGGRLLGKAPEGKWGWLYYGFWEAQRRSTVRS